MSRSKIYITHRYPHGSDLSSFRQSALAPFMSQVTVKKCGIRFDPPAIVVIYLEQTLFKSKLRVRTIPTKSLGITSCVTARNLKSCERHQKYLDQVPEWQLEKLIEMLKDDAGGKKRGDLINEAREKLAINTDEDLNKVDEQTLQAKKAVMNRTFEMNRKRPGDVDFEYDVPVDFNLEGEIESHEWDEPSDLDEF